MKLLAAVLLIIIVLIVLGSLLFLVKFMSEDSWIKNTQGVYVKHGKPSNIPDYVVKQQVVIECAKNLLIEKSKIESISSQCLGDCFDYAVDVVHVPRTPEDNLGENQCGDYLSGRFVHFIELDNQGNVIRIK